MISVEKPGSPAEVLEHHGVKGQKWGVRKNRSTGGGGKSGSTSGRGSGVRAKARSASRTGSRVVSEVLFEYSSQTEHARNQIVKNAGDKFRKELPGIRARHGDYGKMRNRVKRPFSSEAKAYRADVKKSWLNNLEKSANEFTNSHGTRQFTISENGKPNTSQYFWKVSTQAVKHAADGTLTFRPIFDDEGWIIDIELVDDDMAQTMDYGRNFLIHMGLEV